ncbi:MAG: glycosyltransferase [Lachnospiraceae bacterium]|nr:glycosyltransferase [Lachnospiraceae bacterium]
MLKYKDDKGEYTMSSTNNKKVNIILAVYNGEKHLKKQLDSLLAQTYDNIDIYIRDDGSSDGTVEFINEYIKSNTSNKKIILLEPDGKNLRCPGSFYEIIRRCDKADYYALCDQDDYWYPEKIEWAVEKLSGEDDSQMLVYYSASDYTYEDGEFIRKSPKQKDVISLRDVLYYTPGSGFTIVFNEIAREKMILNCNPGVELHDRWLLRGAACFGKAIYDERSTAAHIRHDEAVTAGDSDNKSLITHFIKEELMGDSAKNEKKALQHFFKTFKDELSDKNTRTLKLFCYKKNKLGIRLRKFFYPTRLRQRIPGEIALRILFLTGKI